MDISDFMTPKVDCILPNLLNSQGKISNNDPTIIIVNKNFLQNK